MNPALIYANLVLEPGFWVQLAGTGAGFGLGCLVTALIQRRKGRVFLALPGFSLAVFCLAMHWIVLPGREYTLGPDLQMAVLWFLLSIILVQFSPWVWVSIPGLLLGLAVLLLQHLGDYELLVQDALAAETPLATLSIRDNGVGQEWQITQLNRCGPQAAQIWPALDVPYYLAYDVLEFPSPYRLIMMPYFWY